MSSHRGASLEQEVPGVSGKSAKFQHYRVILRRKLPYGG